MKTIQQTISEVISAAGSDDLGKAEQAIQEVIDQNQTIEILEAERLKWSLETFPEATSISSLRKLEGEIKEVEEHLLDNVIDEAELTEEYADCLMCLFDSAGRTGILPARIFVAFGKKLVKNKARFGRKMLTIHILTLSHEKANHKNLPFQSHAT